MSDRSKLGDFLKEVIDWDWAQFCIAEHDEKYTALQATVFALVRTAASAKLNAIKLAIDRVDGKLETPMRFEYPRIYNVYPFAKERLTPPPGFELPAGLQADLDTLNEAPQEEEGAKIASMTLRETLERLAESPRKTVPALLDAKDIVEADPESFVSDSDDVDKKSPLVKSIIAANLMKLANDRNFDAISEVFDQIDGKLVEVFRVVGEDMYLTQYSEVAPYDAVLNKDGYYQVENIDLAAQWQAKLEQTVGKKGSK